MRKIVIAIALIWLGIVSGILFYNEMLIVNGQEVLLKIVPVDPRDFLRGDYVSLHYDINEMPKNSKYYNEYHHFKGFVTLKKQKDGTFIVDEVLETKPKDQLFLKGEVHGKRIFYSGIDKYFVKEGQGKTLEKSLAQGGFAKISVGKNGEVRIKEIVDKL